MTVVYRNGRPYAYESVRRDGRVTSSYRCCGEVAEIIAEFEAVNRRKAYVKKENERWEREFLETADRAQTDYFDLVEDLARAALYASGYHLHKRQWRKRRDNAQRDESAR